MKIKLDAISQHINVEKDHNDTVKSNQYGMKVACAGHVQRTTLVDGARIGAQNAILCCNTTLGINLRVHGAHNVKYKYPSGARKSNIPYWKSKDDIC